MASNTTQALTIPQQLPTKLPLDAVIRIELQEGVPIMRAAQVLQKRIATLLAKQQNAELTTQEQFELEKYEELDDYLSFVNRLVRNQMQKQPIQSVH